MKTHLGSQVKTDEIAGVAGVEVVLFVVEFEEALAVGHDRLAEEVLAEVERASAQFLQAIAGQLGEEQAAARATSNIRARRTMSRVFMVGQLLLRSPR